MGAELGTWCGKHLPRACTGIWRNPRVAKAPMGAPAGLKQGQAASPTLSDPDAQLDPHTLYGRGGVFTNTPGLR